MMNVLMRQVKMVGDCLKNLDQHKIESFQTNLVHWYEQHKRDLPWRKNQEPYQIWVSEVMLQQTRLIQLFLITNGLCAYFQKWKI